MINSQPLTTNDLTVLSLSCNAQVAIEIAKLAASVQTTSTPLSLIIRTTPSDLRGIAVLLAKMTTTRAGTLVDIAVTDRITVAGRFSVKYFFLSSLYSNRCTIELYVDEITAIPSLASPLFNQKRVFASAGWLEREVWDLFGIYFTDNGDLRRILTDYGFTGHPLRKDFPLTGFHELVYNDAEGRVTSEPVELAQEFRVFHI